MEPINEVDLPPETRLSDEPLIEDVESLDVALLELAWIKSRRETIEAAMDQQIALIKDAASYKMTIEVGDGWTMDFDDRVSQLEAAIVTYVEEHRDDVFLDGKKSRQFAHGVVKCNGQRQRIDFLEGEDEKSVIAKFDKRVPAAKTHGGGVVNKLLSVLSRIAAAGKLKLATCLRIKVELNKTALLNAIKTGACSQADLKKIGLKAETPADKISIDVNDYVLTRAA